MMTGNPVLDGLREVFPLVNFSTLIEVAIEFKDDINAAAEHIIQNVLPNTAPHTSHPNTNEGLHVPGLNQILDVTSTALGDAVDNNTNSNSVQFDQADKTIAENKDSLLVKQLNQSLTGSCSDVFDAPSTSGQDISGEFSSDSLHAGSQHSSSETEISASESDESLHDNGSAVATMRSTYTVNLESLEDVIADEKCRKITLLSNVAAINEMLQEVELNEEKTKRAISEASQAGSDILVKVEELKEMTTLAVEDNNKVAGEIFAEKSILAAEAQELQTRLSNISEETKSFVMTIDEMHKTLQRRLAAAEAKRAAAEKEKLEREASAQQALKEQELSLEAAKQESKRLEQQAQENEELRELLMDRGHVVDALHGEVLGLFDNITQLKLRVDVQLSTDETLPQADETLPQVTPSLSCSAIDQPLHHVESSLYSSDVDVPLQPVSPTLSSLVKSASSKSGSLESFGAASKSSWSSAAESNATLEEDEMSFQKQDDEVSPQKQDDEVIAQVPHGNFALDDSWDVVEDEEIVLPLLA